MKSSRTPLSASLTRGAALIRLATACNASCNAVLSRVGLHVSGRAGFLALANNPDLGIAGLANSATIDESGWVVIPYGDSRHSGKEGRIGSEAERTAEHIEAEKAGVIQRFSREDAVALVNDFRSTWGKIKRAIVGLPVFKGHPDAPRFAKQFPDKMPRGTIADMEARDNGLALKPVLTEQGAEDVGRGWKFVSPYWIGRHVGDDDGRKVIAPFKLLSLGLVPRGNIPDLSLVNAAELESDSPAMKELLIKILAALGQTVAATADDTALANAADAAVANVNTLKADKTAADGKVTSLTTQVSTLSSEKLALTNSATDLTTRATTAETSLKAFREKSAKHRIGLLVKQGKVSAAEIATHETALANAADFDAEVTKLEALPSKLRTQSQLGNLGAGGKEQQSRTQTVIGLVNAHMEANASDYDTAFAAVQADPKNAPIFANMKKPGTSA